MNKFFQVSVMIVALGSLALLASCDEDPPLPDNLTEFESDALGFGSAEQELTINLKLTREADADGTITIAIAPTGVTYGNEFTTEPEASGNTVIVPIVAGATTASFKIKKVANAILDGDEKITFTIASVSEVLVLGEKSELTLSFSEIIAQTGTVEVSGGGPTYPNRVFIDLSANRQTAIARTSWDLAFSSTGDEFRVILNSANGMMARVLDKTDLMAVTAADTVGFGAQLSLSAIFGMAASATDPNTLPDWVKNAATTWVDNPTGDLTKTAIASISATGSENKIYIVNRGTGVNNASLGWKKIRIVRNGSNYSLQHADIGSNTIQNVEVIKNADTRFQYVSLTSGLVTVEPAKTKWDIAWTGYTNVTNFGPGTPTIPYYFQDVVMQNIGGVQTATYNTNATTTLTYDTFTEAAIAGMTFSGSQIGIGSTWRTTGGPPPSPAAGVTANRFYIIKDADGNYYKLQFTSLTTSGERGKPQFKFALVKKAG